MRRRVGRASRTIRHATAAIVIATAAGCGDRHAPTAPNEPPTWRGYPGFDIAIYPGDATLTAWRAPTSPYRWVGYYLAAPCHRDTSWMGTYKTVTALGWGTAVLYVGQQDWSNIPAGIVASRRPVASPTFDRAAAEPSTATAVTCSASLLSAAQGAAEAADAVTKAAGEGVPLGSAIFLDVEFVTTVSPVLVDYASAWIAGVLADGRFRAAVYCSKANASLLYAVTTAAYSTAGRHDAPAFWIASAVGFAITNAPSEVGLSYAAVWQGRFDVAESWGGFPATIDVDVASTASPSAP